MGRYLKTIFWTVIVFSIIFLIAKAFFWSLPFIIVIVAGMYLYGKVKSKFTKETSTSTTYSERTVFTNQQDDVTEVVDVEYQDVEFKDIEK